MRQSERRYLHIYISKINVADHHPAWLTISWLNINALQLTDWHKYMHMHASDTCPVLWSDLSRPHLSRIFVSRHMSGTVIWPPLSWIFVSRHTHVLWSDHLWVESSSLDTCQGTLIFGWINPGPWSDLRKSQIFVSIPVVWYMKCG